jgi:hypothetical protein
MTSFIHDVLKHLQNRSLDLSRVTFILPSKRAGTFLKHELSQLSTKPLFSPYILSIEEFVEELSQLKKLTNIDLLFEFYSVYRKSTEGESLDSFDSFLKWAQMLLQDFNEVDRYLIEPNYIFDYLSAIKETNHWSSQPDQSELIKQYLSFWNKLKNYYADFSTHLINKGVGYQGLIYREAVENIENYIEINPDVLHVFLGFNALNKAEAQIIQALLQTDLAEIFWDIDTCFLANEVHDVGHFIRQYKNNWPFYRTNPFHWNHDHYKQKKKIHVIGIPKNVGQAKYIGELLQDLHAQSHSFQKTAIVLGDENLLMPVLNSIPKEIDALNITMGFSLNHISLASLFERLLLIHKDGALSFHYNDVIEILSHPFIKPIFHSDNGNQAEQLIAIIQKNNLIFLTTNRLLQEVTSNEHIIELLFGNWNKDPIIALNNCLRLILQLKDNLDQDKNTNALELEYLFRFNEVFNSLVEINSRHGYINSIKTLFELFKEVLRSETLDFQGEPLEGLQIMGMLESRVLDFETVIISSVNEGVLPSGKSNNSFIPFDVKLENNLPTYKEKDAVYTYHFYRLLQRAKTVYLIYNTEPDALNAGEKSRFITQLEIEDIHKIDPLIISPKLPPLNQSLRQIKKTEGVISKIEAIFQSGLSPSSLLTYIRNPVAFYSEKVLGVKEADDVEETVAANTLGSVIHETLRELYFPFLNMYLTVGHINSMIPKVEASTEKHFSTFYKQGDLKKGKNLIIFEIAKRYVVNFLNQEIVSLKEGNSIKLLMVETNVFTTIKLDEISFPIKLKGQIDRVDEFNGVIRVIDYKTGKVLRNEVEIVNWEEITTDDSKYGKSFQILMYAFILNGMEEFNGPVEAGIISFKNLNEGFLKFAKKDRLGKGAVKESSISKDFLNAFNTELKTLILEIHNPEMAFIEKQT